MKKLSLLLSRIKRSRFFWAAPRDTRHTSGLFADDMDPEQRVVLAPLIITRDRAVSLAVNHATLVSRTSARVPQQPFPDAGR